jgi:glycine/D-amino acid oxidase-like deaminating enzyme
MEAGETDTAVRPAVAAAQQAFVARRLGDAHDWTFRAGIEAFSCDGLPLLGPMPGRPELLVACGWDGWELSWASAAADALAGVILDGRASVPTALQARRMV